MRPPTGNSQRPRSSFIAAAMLAMLVQVLIPLVQALHLDRGQDGGSSAHLLLSSAASEDCAHIHESGQHEACAICAAIQSLRGEVQLPVPVLLADSLPCLGTQPTNSLESRSAWALATCRPRAPPHA